MEMQDIIDEAIESALRELSGPVPAEVVSYDQAAQKVECKPTVPLQYRGLVIEPPTLKDVPVIQPVSSLGGLVLPIQAGDVVQLVVQGWDVSAWLAGQGEAVTARRFSISDLAAIPSYSRGGLSSDKISSNSPVLWGDPVLIGDSTASDFVALAQKVLAELNEVKSQFDALAVTFGAHTHAGVATGSGVSGTPASGFVISYSPSSVAATKVKAK